MFYHLLDRNLSCFQHLRSVFGCISTLAGYSYTKLKTEPPSPPPPKKKKEEEKEERNDITKFILQLHNCTALVQTVAVLADDITKHKPMLRVGLCGNTLTQCGKNRHLGYIEMLYALHNYVGTIFSHDTIL